MYRKDRDQEETNISNWNAGTEYNELVGHNKWLFINTNPSNNVENLLAILSTDLDLTFQKIYLESTLRKDNNSDEVLKSLKSLRDDIDNLYSQLGKNRGSKSYVDELRKEIRSLQRKIWDTQANFGILFPFDTKKKNNPGEAVRDF